MTRTETRSFTVSPHIIFSLIKAQAGTLGKAITECVMNSVDALATRISIELTNSTIRITDDGAGFQSKDEIEAWFETLGFDHADEGNHRAFGTFGIGRAQLWSFASTIWRTHEFVMDVDIKNKGLDYILDVTSVQMPGLLIEGSLYTELGAGQLAAIEQELRALIKYVEVPVFLNGRALCVDPSTEEWDLETPEAWFKFERSHRGSLAVYNMGVYVKEYWFHQYSIAGLVVTKPKVKLALNMARNDVLIADCKNWPKIVKTLKANSILESKPEKALKPSEADLADRANRLLASDECSSLDFTVFTDIRGRTSTLSGLSRHCDIICFSDPTDAKAKRAHSLKLVTVLRPETLTRFGATNASELREKLMKAPSLMAQTYRYPQFQSLKFFDTLAEALPTFDDQYDLVPEKDITPLERALVGALAKTAVFLRSYALGNDKWGAYGDVRVGTSDQAESWCFGGDTVIDRKALRAGVTGFHGFAKLAVCVLHELVAGLKDSNLVHKHEVAFYELFHDRMHDADVFKKFRLGYQLFVRDCRNKAIDLPASTLTDMEVTL